LKLFAFRNLTIVFCCFLLFIQNTRPQSVIEKEITDWEFRMVGDSVWKPAKVPGTIIDNFVDLSDISNLLHPYYGDNEKLYQWIGEEDWEFRTNIKVEDDLISMVYFYDISFGCLDLYADVFINGLQYTSNNAFIPFKVKELRGSSFDILLVFHSTQDMVDGFMQQNSLLIPGGERVFARTSQYQFGWDWGPKFVNMGMRKPVKLITHVTPQVTFSASTSLLKFNEKFAEFFIDFNITGPYENFDLTYSISNDGKTIQKSALFLLRNNQGDFTTRNFLIENPKLWWPNSLGKNSGEFYEMDFELRLQGDNNILAKDHLYIPICKIDLVQEKDEYGESFYFKVNGERVFAKGANYIPDDSFNPGKKTGELIQMAKCANMNMLRVWGGGNYPDDDFYIACMKNGIMVWQDFMFACAMYPGDEFLRNVSLEASTQVERLRDFNNIAVWCGNNENEEGWKNWGWQRDLNIHGEDSIKIWKDYDSLFHKIFPEIISSTNEKFGINLDYIFTSPKHGWGRKKSMTEGDSHYWGVWWGLEPIEKYNEKVPRFMSEFGMQGMPDLSTLKKVIPDSAMNFESPKFKNHQKHPTGFKTIDHYLKEYLVIPDSIDDYVYATQILQSYALTTGIEAQRRAMPYCMGSLIWQLNDCWPVTSWSLIDSELKTKIAYTDVTEAYKPTIVSVQEEKDNYSIYIINEDGKLDNVFMQILILDFYGNAKFKRKINIGSPEKTSKVYFKLSKKIVEKFDKASIYLDILLIQRGNSKSLNRLIAVESKEYYFVKLNQLKLPPADIQIKKTESGSYSIKSSTYCPYVFISGENDEPDWYVGTVGPRNSGATDGKWIEKVISDPSRIKCLNTLLKK